MCTPSLPEVVREYHAVEFYRTVYLIYGNKKAFKINDFEGFLYFCDPSGTRTLDLLIKSQ